jgi:hypothetical protein
LTDGGYRRIEGELGGKFSAASTRLFEDLYALVGVMIFETWHELESSWPEAQGTFVDLISNYVTASDAKAWDAYIVLMTPAPMSRETNSQAADIRYDTSRVRKLVASGDELKSLGDVGRVLLPLLPLESGVEVQEREFILEQLPNLLSREGVPEGAVRAIVDAFVQQRALMECLMEYVSQK